MIKRHQFGMRLAAILSGLELSSVKREEGQTLVEYALILSLLALAVAGAVLLLGTKISGLFTNIGSSI